MSELNVVIVKPTEGWGFKETVDGQLAPRFAVEILESGVELGGGVVGWRGKAVEGKYAGALVEMLPRHLNGDEIAVVNVRESAGGSDCLFSGIAETAGLKRDWK